MLEEDLDDTYDISVSGDLTVIRCSVRARPVADIEWTYNNQSLPLGVTAVSTTHELTGDIVTVSRLQWTHGEAERLQAGGVYRCTAMNGAGQITSRPTKLHPISECAS